MLAPRGEIARAVDFLRHAVSGEFLPRKGIAQPLFDLPNGQMRHVGADPLPPQLLRRMNGGALAAQRVEHDIAAVKRGVEDTLQQGIGFLRGC